MPLKPFAVSLSDAPAYWSLGELLTMVATAEQIVTLAAHYGAEVLENWP